VHDGLHEVVPHAALRVGFSQVWVSLIAGLVAAGGPDQAQQRAAHQDQQQAGGGARRDERFHGGTAPRPWLSFVLLSLTVALDSSFRLASDFSFSRGVSLSVLLVQRRLKVSELEGGRWEEGLSGGPLHPPLSGSTTV